MYNRANRTTLHLTAALLFLVSLLLGGSAGAQELARQSGAPDLNAVSLLKQETKNERENHEN